MDEEVVDGVLLKRESGQLLLMEIHIAYSFPFFLNAVIQQLNIFSVDFVYVMFRFVLCCFELMFIYILTDKEIIEEFS